MKLLTAEEVAQMLGLTKPRVYDLIRRDILPHIRFEKDSVRVPEDLLRAFILAGGKKMPGEWRNLQVS